MSYSVLMTLRNIVKLFFFLSVQDEQQWHKRKAVPRCNHLLGASQVFSVFWCSICLGRTARGFVATDAIALNYCLLCKNVTSRHYLSKQVMVNISGEMHWNVWISKGGFFAESEKCLGFSFSAMLLESASAPGSLQELFLKRKKDFIQKSLRRVEEIKQRERKNEKPEGRQLQRRKSETLSSQKEHHLIPGMCIWACDMGLGLLLLVNIKENLSYYLFYLCFCSLGYSWISQGCGELLFPHWAASCKQTAFIIVTCLCKTTDCQRTALSELMHL